MLYIVSTPIGNLGDMTFRAVEVLKSVDLIAAEDTRHTGQLLKHFEISTPTTSCHEHNEKGKLNKILSLLRDGKDVALVSDAGTPGINDPGYRLIQAVIEEGFEMTAIPGACAVITALTLSGLPTDRFCFEGFLPVKSGSRRNKLESLKGEERTVIVYESVHRICKALKDIVEVLDDPDIVCARELTKKFEDVRRAPASEILAHFEAKPPKGEFVLCWNLK